MYPSSTSSSSQGSLGSSSGGGTLMRYDSAPGSLFTTAVDSVTREFSNLGPQTHHAPPATNFTPDQSTAINHHPNDGVKAKTTIGWQRSYVYPGGASSSSSSSLVRHSSSPAGFLNQLAATASGDNGFSITRGIGSYNSKEIGDHNIGGITRLNSQLSFTRPQEAFNSEISIDNDERKSTTNSHINVGYANGPWDETSPSPMMFTVGTSKRAKTANEVNDLDTMKSQFQFSIMPQTTSMEMATMRDLLHIPQDHVTCKTRAKRGCATHPRSIAERERRTRISGKLKKLPDLLPNMDKQTSYADMLDVALQHIKSLNDQVQNLKKELENCTCDCKKRTSENT
ncbi:hypothetical protein ACJIZ3_018059 [Penstemon smallii]|uniref:BHLH domain-containing protein n=1 Tax=Penstemon smallii TaxID=265156 RepID=A0ABD3SXD8_9LAMI